MTDRTPTSAAFVTISGHRFEIEGSGLHRAAVQRALAVRLDMHEDTPAAAVENVGIKWEAYGIRYVGPVTADPLAEIAKTHLNIDTLDRRNSDRLDFHEVAVWSLRDALAAAYELGRRSNMEGA